MNIAKALWRSARAVNSVLPASSAYLRTVSSLADSTVTKTKPLTDSTVIKTEPSVAVSNEVELDKLYKKVELEMRGIDPAVLLSYSWFCVAAASHLGIDVTKSWALRKSEKERLTLLRCVHIYKKHRVQYEMRTYFRFIHLQRLTQSTCDTYLEYIERNLPEGCALKVTKVECTKVPDHLVPPSDDSNN